MNKLVLALALLALLSAGCLQEKKLDLNGTVPTATPSGGGSFTPTAIPQENGATVQPTAQATTLPSPTPEAAPNCTIIANPEALTGPGDVVVIVGFNKMPSDGSVSIGCGFDNPSSITIRTDAKGVMSAFKKCAYPDVSSTTVFKARATASGGFSCSKDITVR